MSCNHSYGNHKTCEPDRGWNKCKIKHPRPQKILLECGEGTGSRTFTSSDDPPFQLAHVTIDTTCLNRPEVLIKFSSIVRMDNLAVDDQDGTVRLQYELFRVCNHEEPKSLGIWMFEEVNVDEGGFECQEESFNFIFCECTNCPRCCEYFVTVTPVEITNATAMVSNGRMAALSQPLCDSLKDGYKNCDSKYDHIKFKERHPRPKEILLVCGQGNGSVVFRDISPEPPADIAHVVLDTTNLSKPKVLIEFSSIIKIDEEVNDLRLQFELFRMCGDGEPLSRGIWTFERSGVDIDDLELQKAFSFIFCECEAPSDCCEYFVTVTAIEVTDSDDHDAVVDNVRITALAQSSGDCIYEDNYKKLDGKRDCIDCKPKHPKEKKILLECGDGTGSRTFTSSNDSAFQLAHVKLDTTCLCKPMVNIEFSSIVSFDAIAENGDVQLRYELFRVCDNRKPISVGIWSVDRMDFDIIYIDKSTNTFDFTFCDCITCPGCCEYIVTVTPITITEGVITATVSNGRIAALAQDIK
ncbi:DUF4489 domain-containing protein [Anaeromicrobium sediminis]|nr:DUF4489 domain-containing protein [Anaeromicrobium sediminis]